MVFDYTSSRAFLQAAYAQRKAAWSGFSHRYVSRKTHSSSGYFTRLLSGSLQLTTDRVPYFASLFSLTPQEEAYLHQLVVCETSDDKVSAFRDLLALRGIRLTKVDDFGLYSAWYVPVLREVLALVDADDEFIGSLLRPSVSAQVVADTRKLLIEKGFLSSDGRTHLLVTSGSGPDARKALRHYADDCLALARSVLDQEDRELSFVTLSVTESVAEEIKEKIRALRREVLDMAAGCEHPDRVIHLQLHSIPITEVFK